MYAEAIETRVAWRNKIIGLLSCRNIINIRTAGQLPINFVSTQATSEFKV